MPPTTSGACWCTRASRSRRSGPSGRRCRRSLAGSPRSPGPATRCTGSWPASTPPTRPRCPSPTPTDATRSDPARSDPTPTDSTRSDLSPDSAVRRAEGGTGRAVVPPEHRSTVRSYRRTVVTDAPPEQVWAYLADFTTTNEWDPRASHTRLVTGDGGVGSRYETDVSFLGRTTRMAY